MTFTGIGYEGTIQETQFAEMLGAIADHGVVGTFNDSSMSAAKVVGARSLRCQPGKILVPGLLGVLDTATTSDVATVLGGSLPRVDLLIAKFNWSGAGTITLEMKEGTPNADPKPPGVQQDPGVIFEVPIANGRLNPGDGEYTATTVVDRRYWIEAGKYVLANTTQLPPGRAGALAYRPDVHQLLAHNGTAWDTFKAESDTGWQAIAGPYPGFAGSTWGRIKNGMATIILPWTKGTAGMTNQNVSVQLLGAYAPSFDGVLGTFYAGAPKAPIAATLGTDAILSLDSVTLNAGATLRGSMTYPVG